ncbi:MAG TPA: fatty acid--CoA ligase family protein [Bradyrhizobium sp.]|nr:fatty acid--CoA ligase family protein [Bradyrhizobium sp.]
MTGALALRLDRALAESGSSFVDSSGTRLSAAMLLPQAEQVAALLAQANLHGSEPVHLEIGNRPVDIAAMLGIWRAGGTVVPIHTSSVAATRMALATKTGARFLIDGTGLQRIGAEPPAPRALLSGSALVIFTSGTTGSPKGVVVGHDALAGKMDVLKSLLSLRRDDVVAIPLQLNFIFGLWACLLSIESGADIGLIPKFSAETAGRWLDSGATVLAAVPTMLRTLLAGTPPAAPRLRMILAGGEVMPPALNAKVSAIWPSAGIYDLYGSTETGSCDFCLDAAGQIPGRGSIGVPTSNVAFRIRKSDGTLAPHGEAGELEIASPYSMLGYLDDPDLTKASFNDGYFRSGDLARIRSDGRTEIVGRSKEIISRGGNKVSPLELDHLLSSHPDVAVALCTGVPDERLGETIHAMVVLNPGACLAEADLLRWASGRIERFKLPEKIHFCDALPIGNTGKANRTAARQLILAQRSNPTCQ